MKIVHISPDASFTDGWGYQENLLPKYQHLLGNEVTLIVRNVSRCTPDQSLVEVPSSDFISKDGFRVIQKRIRLCLLPQLSNVFSCMDVYDILCDINPDYIYFHGLVSSTINQVVKYKKNVSPKTIIVVDNHQDCGNCTLHKTGLKNLLLRTYYRWLYRKNEKYISAVYGVTPCRKQYEIDVFGVAAEKAKLMIMGADDQIIDFDHKIDIRRMVREKFQIEDDAFLIVTGGKIDKRKNIDLIMKACGEMRNLRLLIFGNVQEDVSDEFNSLLRKYNNIIFAGWASSAEQYSYYLAADLVMFLSSHSVMWEQACASKTPCLFGIKEGMEHLNNGGNSDFIESVTVDGIRSKIEQLIVTGCYTHMKRIAESDATDIYRYSHIAEKTLEDAKTFYEQLE